jgi:hypothetical protein
MGSRKIALTVAVSAIAAMLTVGTAMASPQPPNPTPDPGSAGFAAGLAAPNSTGPSPYVQASSPAQAMDILNALQSPQTASPAAKAAAVEVHYGPCTLKPGVIYMRNSGGLGAKPITDCTVPVTSIRHDTDLKYHWLLWWWDAASYPSGNNGQARLEQKNVQWHCNGNDSTTWAGTTVGTIVYGGETFYARVYQGETDQPCGA